MIHHVRDARDGGDDEGKMLIDPGVADKRLFVLESEFASVLRRMGSPGNSLSQVLRCAWDGSRLSTMTRKDPMHATNAHVSVVAHITIEELKRNLTSVEMANGFANRFLWLCVRRSKELPDGGAVPELDDWSRRVREALQDARSNPGQIARDA